MSTFTVKIDPASLRRVDQALSAYPKAAKRELRRAVQRATKSGETSIVRTVARTSSLTLRAVRTSMATNRAGVSFRVSGTGGTPTGHIQVRDRPYTLRRFRARQNRRGVSVTIYRGRGRKLVRGAFISSGRGGVEQVFIRRRIGGRRVGRKPIDVLRTASALSFLDNSPGGRDRAITRVNEVLVREVSTRVSRILDRGTFGGRS